MKCKIVYPKFKTNKLSIELENGYYHIILTESEGYYRLGWVAKESIGKIIEVEPTPVELFNGHGYNIYYISTMKTVHECSVFYPKYINSLFLEKNLSFIENE
jgi:hypothetical protein